MIEWRSAVATSISELDCRNEIASFTTPSIGLKNGAVLKSFMAVPKGP
jgi:hypothetical protein